MNVNIVINPNAGRQTVLRASEDILKAFREEGHEASLLVTKTREELAEILTGEDPPPDLLVCCGGDGTLSEMVNFLLTRELSIPLGYIPAGSTNDYASFLDLSRDPVEAARRIARGASHPLDAGRFGDRHFVYIASFGAFTATSYEAPQSLKNALGHMAYLIEGLKELPQLKSHHVSLRTESFETEGDYLFGAVTNSTSFGGVVHMDPEKVGADDGLLEILLVRMPQNLGELNKIVFSIMSGNYDDSVITFLHARQAEFLCEEPMPWSLDGEYAPGSKRVEIEAIHNAFTLTF